MTHESSALFVCHVICPWCLLLLTSSFEVHIILPYLFWHLVTSTLPPVNNLLHTLSSTTMLHTLKLHEPLDDIPPLGTICSDVPGKGSVQQQERWMLLIFPATPGSAMSIKGNPHLLHQSRVSWSVFASKTSTAWISYTFSNTQKNHTDTLTSIKNLADCYFHKNTILSWIAHRKKALFGFFFGQQSTVN